MIKLRMNRYSMDSSLPHNDENIDEMESGY